MNKTATTTSSSDDYVTVVSVEEAVTSCQNESDINLTTPATTTKSSQFVTVLSISAGDVDSEVVNIHRRTNERLGFGLKFQGGTKSNERVEHLYIQSCASDSPASRARATWGMLKEGDEILEINATCVKTLTRIQCVQKLKDGSDPLKLLIRDGKNTEQQTLKRPAPPPPPPVPPRKIGTKKPVVRILNTTECKEITPPPEAEFYLNLFEQNEHKASESDGDSASTLSTVVDKFSLCSSMSMSSISESEYEANVLSINTTELAKVLAPFQLLEKEFHLETTTKIEIVKPTEIKVLNCVDSKPIHETKPVQIVTEIKIDDAKDYENVDVQSIATARKTIYENIEVRAAPTPMPRHTLPPKLPSPRAREFNTIQTWLADSTETIHECPVSSMTAVSDATQMPVEEFLEEPDAVEDNELDCLEEGEKLGPPELLALPGPSEVYFNFPWATSTLSTIGEEGEDLSIGTQDG